MTTIRHLTPAFAVAPRIETADVGLVAAAGFRAIVAVRPDGEDASGPAAHEIAALARALGLAFRYVPASPHDVLEPETVSRFEAALDGLRGPVLAYCTSGTRAAIVWALAAARHQPAACVSAVLRDAGLRLDGIEDELREQPRSSAAKPASLAVVCGDPAAA